MGQFLIMVDVSPCVSSSDGQLQSISNGNLYSNDIFGFLGGLELGYHSLECGQLFCHQECFCLDNVTVTFQPQGGTGRS